MRLLDKVFTFMMSLMGIVLFLGCTFLWFFKVYRDFGFRVEHNCILMWLTYGFIYSFACFISYKIYKDFNNHDNED